MHTINNFETQYQSCKHRVTQEDDNGDEVISFCTHQNNPLDEEGNCMSKICPLKTLSTEEIEDILIVIHWAQWSVDRNILDFKKWKQNLSKDFINSLSKE